MFAVCMGKQCKSVFRHCDLGRAKSLSLSTRGSGHVTSHPVPGSHLTPHNSIVRSFFWEVVADSVRVFREEAVNRQVKLLVAILLPF